MAYFAAENPDVRMVHVQPGVVETEIDPSTAAIAQDSGEFHDEIFLPHTYLTYPVRPLTGCTRIHS